MSASVRRLSQLTRLVPGSVSVSESHHAVTKVNLKANSDDCEKPKGNSFIVENKYFEKVANLHREEMCLPMKRRSIYDETCEEWKSKGSCECCVSRKHPGHSRVIRNKNRNIPHVSFHENMHGRCINCIAKNMAHTPNINMPLKPPKIPKVIHIPRSIHSMPLMHKIMRYTHHATNMPHAHYATLAMPSVAAPIKDIPGPKSYPIVGSLPSMIADKEFDKNRIDLYFAKLLREYGPIVSLQLPFQAPLVLLGKPQDMKTLYRLTRANPVRRGLQALKAARYLDPYYGKKAGIAAEDGDEWWRVRTQVQATVLRLDNIRHYLPGMDAVTLDLLDRIARERDESGHFGGDLKDLLSKWALENIGLISLDQRLGCLDPLTPGSEQLQYLEAAQTLMSSLVQCEVSALWKMYRTPAFKDLQRSVGTLTRLCDKRLSEYKERLSTSTQDGLGRPNMLTQLLNKPSLSREDVVTFMIDLIPGGVETSSSNAIVVLYLLAQHPRVQDRVREEVRRVVGAGGQPMETRRFGQLSYVRAVFKECNRVMPPALGVNRFLTQDTQLGGYLLKEGSNCLLLSSISSQDPGQFPQPKDFLPERWLRTRPLGAIDPYASMPFSQGTRMCVGRRIAEQELCVFMARTLQRYRVGWSGSGGLTRSHMMVYSPEQPFNFTFTDV